MEKNNDLLENVSKKTENLINEIQLSFGIEGAFLIEKFISEFCKKNGITVKELRTKDRREKIVKIRQILCYILRNIFNLTLSKTAFYTGLAEHSTVLYSCKIVKIQTNRFYDITF